MFIIQTTVLNFGDLFGDGIGPQMQNFSTISPKLRQLSQKSSRTGIPLVKTTIVLKLSSDDIFIEQN